MSRSQTIAEKLKRKWTEEENLQSSQTTVTVVIPQRKNTHLTKRLISQIRNMEGDQLPVLIVNDDPGETPLLDQATAVLDNRGRGVTAAWNLGIDRSSTRHVVLLNNDVKCLWQFTEQLATAAGETGISGVRSRVEPLVRRYVLEGWCLCLSKPLWRSLGGFNEQMTTYFSDTDFQLRAEAAGGKLTVVPLRGLKHLGHRTAHDRSIFPERAAVYTRDRLTFQDLHPRMG